MSDSISAHLSKIIYRSDGIMEQKKNTRDIAGEYPGAGGAERQDSDRLPEPPYEKRFSELGTPAAEGGSDDGIKLYRYTGRTTGMELQIRSDYQIVFSLSGGCDLVMQGRRSHLPDGGILLIARGVPHLIEIPDGSVIVGAMIPVAHLKKSFNKIVEFQSPVSSFISTI